MKNLVICDLDGTLCDNRHRRHLVEGTKRYFDRFDALAQDDVPFPAVVAVLHALKHTGHEIWFFSGRSAKYEGVTRAWLEKWNLAGLHTRLKMRPVGSSQPDDEMKESWLLGLLPVERERLLFVLDDRARVVAMWRRNGVDCWQVAEGDF